MSERLVVAGRRYDKFHIVHNGDPGAGFSALITYALNGARRAEAHNWLPVVNFSGETTPHFYDPEYGENVWEYYFEPIAGVAYSELAAWMQAGEVSPDLVHQYSDREVVHWHVHDPERITTFWSADPGPDRARWLLAKRELGRQYLRRYVRLKPQMQAKADALAQRLLTARYTFGVHIRGTDFHYADPTYPQEYFDAIHEKARTLGLSDFAVFLATDQTQFVEAFEREFPGRVLTSEAARSRNDVAPFMLPHVRPLKKGEDVLLDILLLSRCRFLFKSASAVGEYALWFNPELECRDFALSRNYVERRGLLYTGAYLKMNIDSRGPLAMRALTFRRKVEVVLDKLRRRLRKVRAL